jgi:hypothetical protein
VPNDGKERGNANENGHVIIDMVTRILKTRYILPYFLPLSFIHLATSKIHKVLFCCHVTISVISKLQIVKKNGKQKVVSEACSSACISPYTIAKKS